MPIAQSHMGLGPNMVPVPPEYSSIDRLIDWASPFSLEVEVVNQPKQIQVAQQTASARNPHDIYIHLTPKRIFESNYAPSLKMSTPARRRLMRDFKVCSTISRGVKHKTNTNPLQRMQTDPPAGVSASPISDNVMTWYVLFFGISSYQIAKPAELTLPTRNAVIIGPSDTPFEDGTFRLVMNFEEQYPNKPPAVKFISTMFHPNVYNTGELCLDILQNRWSPTYDVAAVLTSIQRWVKKGSARAANPWIEGKQRDSWDGSAHGSWCYGRLTMRQFAQRSKHWLTS